MLEHLTPDIDTRHPVDFLEPEDEERDLALDVAGIGRIPVDAIRVFLTLLIPCRGSGPTRWKTATARLLALAHAVNFESVRSIPLTQLAEEIGLSRASLSLMNVRLRDAGGLDHRNGKSDAAREAYSKSASRVWQDRKARVGLSERTDVATRHGRSSKQTEPSQA